MWTQCKDLLSLWQANIDNISQYNIGNTSYIDVPGEADAREVAQCGFSPQTKRVLWLRAVNSVGIGDQYEHAEVSTLGEYTGFIINIFE